MKKITLFVLILHLTLNSYAQTIDSLKKNIQLSSYFESYYTYDLNSDAENKIKGLVNHNKNNQIAINLAMIKANYTSQSFRANIGIMTGTYAEDNYSIYDANYNNIYESNIGLKLGKKHNLWFDIGIFPSHIGAESAIGAGNWTLTRSLQAESSPYYEAGAKVSYTSRNNKWFVSLLALNGWQNIVKSSNFPLSMGTQLQYKPNTNLLFNSSSYIGNNNSFSSAYLRNRYFHNFYAQIQWTKKLGTLIGFDIGSEQMFNNNNRYYLWYSPLFIAKYSINHSHSFSVRAEYLNDYYRRVFQSNNFGFVGTGFSVNYDYALMNQIKIRLEGKMFNTVDPVFINSDGLNKKNTSITTSISYKFN